MMRHFGGGRPAPSARPHALARLRRNPGGAGDLYTEKSFPRSFEVGMSVSNEDIKWRRASLGDENKHGKALLKALVLAVFIIAAIVVVRSTAARTHLTPGVLGGFLDAAGFWGPLVFILVYTAGACLFVPGILLTGLGAAIFGPYRGFVYVWIGAMMGASAAFFIGRTLGREFAASLIGGRFRKYDDAIERNGFATVLYLRLVYFPFTLMNFGMGLTKVHFWDYFFGTGIGIIVETFVLTYSMGAVKEIWSAGDWTRLFSLKVVFSVCLFIFSFFIPKIAKRIKGKGQDG